MDPRILDAKGREIRVGDRVKHDGREYTVVSLGAPYGDIVRIGYWHGSLDEYKPHFCIPGTVAEETNGGDFLCSDLQLLDDREEEDGVGEADWKARAEDAEEALLRVAELLARIGPDEVLDQDKPAVRGRRWVISDEAGMRAVAAYRIALEAFTRHGHSHDYPLPSPPGGTRSARYGIKPDGAGGWGVWDATPSPAT